MSDFFDDMAEASRPSGNGSLFWWFLFLVVLLFVRCAMYQAASDGCDGVVVNSYLGLPTCVASGKEHGHER